jgi:3-oxoacyl-[acyl-carrier protein] reductase
MNTPQEKRIALVTGGESGIGAACCRELAKAGFTVGVHYFRSESDAAGIVKECLALHPSRGGDPNAAFLFHADLAQEAGVDQVYDTLKERGPLEVLVNNAGMTIDAPLFSAKLSDFDRVVAVNMRSVWYLTKRLARLMIRNRRGRIINMASVVGCTGNPTQTIYGMTKAAVINFTKTMAAELAEYGILVNAIAPGFIDTAMTQALTEEARTALLRLVPLKRMGTPEEVAHVARFLATDASYCTGTVIHVNGGMYGG